MKDIEYFFNKLGVVTRLSQIEQINDLLKQLSPTTKTITFDELREVMQHGTVIFAVDERTSDVVGMVTLTHCWKPTCFFGSVEDLVVHTDYRQHGIGTKLMKLLLATAAELKMAYVNLTSHPDRTEANRRYVALGAEQRETNVYRFKIE